MRSAGLALEHVVHDLLDRRLGERQRKDSEEGEADVAEAESAETPSQDCAASSESARAAMPISSVQ